MPEFIWFLVLGGAAGWIARRIMKRPKLNLVANIVLGMVGAFVGGFALALLGMQPVNIIGSLATATFGAVALIWLASRTQASD